MKVALILFVWFILPVPEKCQARDVAIPFEYYQRVIFLTVTVNGTPMLFLFDTGANTSAIDEQVAGQLGIPKLRTDSVVGSAGTIQVQMVRIKELAAGLATMEDLELTTQDLAYSLVPPGRKLDGILGTDFMRHFVVTIDFSNRQITFSKKSKCLDQSIPFEMDNNIPMFKATLADSIRLHLRYDSGSSLFETDSTYINVTDDTWKVLQRSDSTLKPTGYFTGTGTGGEVKLAVVRVASVQVLEQQILHPFLIVQPKQGYFARPDAVGFFGNNLLEKYKMVVLDFRKSTLCLQK